MDLYTCIVCHIRLAVNEEDRWGNPIHSSFCLECAIAMHEEMRQADLTYWQWLDERDNSVTIGL